MGLQVHGSNFHSKSRKNDDKLIHFKSYLHILGGFWSLKLLLKRWTHFYPTFSLEFHLNLAGSCPFNPTYHSSCFPLSIVLYFFCKNVSFLKIFFSLRFGKENKKENAVWLYRLIKREVNGTLTLIVQNIW